MAAVGVAKILWQGQTGKVDANEREWTIVRLVEVDSQFDDAPVVCRAPGVAFLGQPYAMPGGTFDYGALLREITPARYEEEKSRLFWTVTERYSTKADEDKNEQKDEDGNEEDDPEKWRDEIDITQRHEMHAVDKAINRVDLGMFRPNNTEGPIINSAGVVLNAYEEELWIQVIRITKRKRRYPSDQIWSTTAVVNDDAFTISHPKQGLVLNVDRYQAMMPPLAASLFYMNGKNGKPQAFWKCPFEVHIERKYGWRLQVQDKGTHKSDLPGTPDGRGGSSSYSENLPDGMAPFGHITDKKGIPITEDCLLDGHGQPLKAGQDAVYLPYTVIKEIPFGPIGL